MSSASKDVTFSLKVTVNREKTKVLFADVDSSFADVLMSFLTLPLGTIVRILKNHYEHDDDDDDDDEDDDDDAPPTFGSLTTLYNGLSNLDTAHFLTEGAKSILLHPRSSLDALRRRLKLDISDSPPDEFFICEKNWNKTSGFRGVSVYYDNVVKCKYIDHSHSMIVIRVITNTEDAVAAYDDTDGTKVMRVRMITNAAADDDGTFTVTTATFVVTDDLRIVPTSSGLLQIATFLDIKDMDEAEQVNVTFGYNEVMDLLKAALISSTPLLDVIFKKTTHIKSTRMQLQSWTLSDGMKNGSTTLSSKKIMLRAFVQKSTNKFLYAQAEADFVELLFSFLVIPLGGVECLLGSKSFIKSFDMLYMSVADHVHIKYFQTNDARNMLIKPNITHGYISENHILPLNEEQLSGFTEDMLKDFTSVRFPKGQGKYLKTPRTFMVTDDLTVTPLCLASSLSYLKGMKVSISDVKEVELQIGFKEALGILRASLTSSSAFSDGLNLADHISQKRPREESDQF